jgi:PAS domain S-box-containing protein
MKDRKLNFYMLLTGLGFIAAIAVGTFVFFQLQSMTVSFSYFTQKTYEEQIEHIYTTTLASAAEYIEKQYPIVHDTGLLKQEAGSGWFWDLADELHKLAETFNFKYVYYVEKKENGIYVFLMSADIRKDLQPELVGEPVWLGAPPPFIEEAWETKQLTFSPEPTINEWGTVISAAKPIITDGNVVGILGIDYDISFLDSLVQQESWLRQQEGALLRRMRNILIISLLGILMFMGYQLWLSNSVIMVPLREKEADERTRLMLDATPMICTLWDVNGNIIDCNKETLNIVGISDKQELLENFFDLHPQYQPNGESTFSVMERFTKATLETGYQCFELMSMTANGEPLPMETTAVRVPWEKGWCIACYSRDLREIKAKEAAVLESENRMRLMLDKMVVACCFFDSDYNLLECSQRTVELFGCKDKETFITNFFEYMPDNQPDGSNSRDKAKKNIQSAFDFGKIVFFWEHLKADGTPLPMEVTINRVEWKGGYRVVSNMQDISELVETEGALRRVLATAEASPNLTLFLGAGGNIEYMNPAVSAVSGFSQEELQRDGLTLMFSPGDFDRLNREYIASALKNQIVDFEMTLVAKDGQKRDFSFSLLAVQMYDGTTGIGVEGRDITELKRMQRDMASAKEQAERALVHEIQYNKAKNDFLSKVSHELRTPMNAIIGMTGVAKKTADEKERDHCISVIDESSKHLLGIVNDILDISAINTGKFISTPQLFSFNRMASSVMDTIAPDAQLKDLTFNISIDSQIPDSVISDDRRIRQILIELLYNAVKFTPEKGKIAFYCWLLENHGNECIVRFEVTDTGIGISPEARERLWDIFEQGDNSITREYDGMGLGLALTKRIVDLMKGELRVESELGKGSRFICDMPFGVNQADLRGEEADSKETAANQIDLKGKRILVVDDVDINREILFVLLERSDAILDAAEDGDTAVKMFLQNKYDMVLMDIHMPVMDGFTAAKQIRASTLPRAKTIPIISISADSSPDIHTKCLEAGITDHLEKPVDANDLYGMIARWMHA